MSEYVPFGNLLVTALDSCFNIAGMIPHPAQHNRLLEGANDKNGVVSTTAGATPARRSTTTVNISTTFASEQRPIITAVCVSPVFARSAAAKGK